MSSHLVDQELDGSSVGVSDGLHDGEGVLEETLESLVGEVRSRSDLDDLRSEKRRWVSDVSAF